MHTTNSGPDFCGGAGVKGGAGRNIESRLSPFILVAGNNL